MCWKFSLRMGRRFEGVSLNNVHKLVMEKKGKIRGKPEKGACSMRVTGNIFVPELI